MVKFLFLWNCRHIRAMRCMHWHLFNIFNFPKGLIFLLNLSRRLKMGFVWYSKWIQESIIFFTLVSLFFGRLHLLCRLYRWKAFCGQNSVWMLSQLFKRPLSSVPLGMFNAWLRHHRDGFGFFSMHCQMIWRMWFERVLGFSDNGAMHVHFEFSFRALSNHTKHLRFTHPTISREWFFHSKMSRTLKIYI